MKTVTISKRELVQFLKSVKLHLNQIDNAMEVRDPREKYMHVAVEMNRLNLDYDQFLHFTCGVPLNKLQSVLNKGFKLPD